MYVTGIQSNTLKIAKSVAVLLLKKLWQNGDGDFQQDLSLFIFPPFIDIM